MESKKKVFLVRLDKTTEHSLASLAKATNRTKAEATRMAIQIASRLFVSETSKDLEKQSEKEIVPSE